MNHQAFYQEFKHQLKTQYLSVRDCPLPPVSPFVINIEPKTVQEIKQLIKALYKMAHCPNYPYLIKTEQTEYIKKKPSKSTALLMAYDFHIDEQGQPKLIEVNTQASGYLVSDLVDQTHRALANSPKKTSPALLKLKQSFEEEWQAFSKKNHPPAHTFILDHQIPKQKMYIEFLMYKDLLNNQWHWPCQLMEIGEVMIHPEGFLTNRHNQKAEMIYNRLTDFYFEKWPQLKQAFFKQKSCISPHPVAYLLLADKARLVEWSDPQFLNPTGLSEEEKAQIRSALLPANYVHSMPAESLWKQKKALFFKPLRSYGGKAVYRGKNLSRKMFERILKTPALFQKAVPPSVFKDPSGVKWKYDVRAYVYRDEVQKLCARVYQGQVTGFQQPFSGFATIYY